MAGGGGAPSTNEYHEYTNEEQAPIRVFVQYSWMAGGGGGPSTNKEHEYTNEEQAPIRVFV